MSYSYIMQAITHSQKSIIAQSQESRIAQWESTLGQEQLTAQERRVFVGKCKSIVYCSLSSIQKRLKRYPQSLKSRPQLLQVVDWTIKFHAKENKTLVKKDYNLFALTSLKRSFKSKLINHQKVNKNSTLKDKTRLVGLMLMDLDSQYALAQPCRFIDSEYDQEIIPMPRVGKLATQVGPILDLVVKVYDCFMGKLCFSTKPEVLAAPKKFTIFLPSFQHISATTETKDWDEYALGFVLQIAIKVSFFTKKRITRKLAELSKIYSLPRFHLKRK